MPKCLLCNKKQFVVSTGGNCLRCARLLGQLNTLRFNQGHLSIKQAKEIRKLAVYNQAAFVKKNGYRRYNNLEGDY